jgi:hypothetical protein
MIAIETLAHDWRHRIGALERLGREHPFGPACRRPNGCASVVEEAAQRSDMRQFRAECPASSPPPEQHDVI